MTKVHSIEVSEKTLKEFEDLKEAIKEIYQGHEINNDQVLEAMIAWFFDSLQHIKNAQAGAHWHSHDHWDHECCGEGKCEDDWDCKCC